MTDETKRRPIRSRHWRVSQAGARWLARRGVSPNSISLAGMAAGVTVGILLAATSLDGDRARYYWIAAALAVQFRLAANMLDGMVAELNQARSPVGELFNEVPDRVSDTAIFVGLGHAVGGTPAWGFTAALAAMFTAYVRVAITTAGSPPDFRGPMAKQHRMFVVTCLELYSGMAPESWLSLELVAARITTTNVALAVIALGSLITAARRLHAAASFLNKESSRRALPSTDSTPIP